MEELKVLVACWEKETGEPMNIVGLALSSRKNLCIHPEVINYCRISDNVKGCCRSFEEESKQRGDFIRSLLSSSV